LHGFLLLGLGLDWDEPQFLGEGVLDKFEELVARLVVECQGDSVAEFWQIWEVFFSSFTDINVVVDYVWSVLLLLGYV